MRGLLILAAAFLFTMTAAETVAAPKRPDGGVCDSTGTARKTGTDESGNKLDCLWDTCTYSECGTSGGQISNCVKKTTYSNARDCKAASVRGVRPGLTAPLGNRMLKKAP